MISSIYMRIYALVVFLSVHVYAAEYTADPMWSSFSPSYSESSSTSSSSESYSLSPCSYSSSSCSCSNVADNDSFEESHSDSDAEPLLKYAKMDLPSLPEDTELFEQTQRFLQSGILEPLPSSLSKQELCLKIQKLQQHIIILSHFATTLRQRQQDMLTKIQTIQLAQDKRQAMQRLEQPSRKRTFRPIAPKK